MKLYGNGIIVTICEELDQYAGEKEIRTVLQSTMRGGDLFWDFRTFNPPISKNNWANEYADTAETLDNTLVVRNTYLDVPPEWLGQAFIDEAEDLKRINESAYEHEYMGKAIGTGGDVFQNVEDKDMSEKVPVYDFYGSIIGYKPLYETFDHIYNGLDWGFATDPLAFVKCHFDKKNLDLYIYREFITHKTRNEDSFRMLYIENKLIDMSELLTADSAEPKSVADYRAYGAFIRGAEKGPDSVRYGIKWLQGLRHIYIDKRTCPNAWREFINYEYEQDREGNFISAYPDENNHCLVGDTLVNTPNGQFKIKDLVGKSGKIYSYGTENKEFVIADFINCRMTFEKAEIWEIELENGDTIQCTYDHPILTSNRGYVIASELTIDDDIISIY